MQKFEINSCNRQIIPIYFMNSANTLKTSPCFRYEGKTKVKGFLYNLRQNRGGA